ncbi:MAG: hypothetical protein HY820_20770 [Acidobacteria bacterium]|nr:hypothetical protein [Acidobacteriota bacterium]
MRGLQFVSRNFLFEQLTTPSSLDWLARYARSADTAILRRIVELNPAPEGDYCLSFWGAAGRQELLTSVAPSVAVLVADGASLEPFRVWGRQLESAMAGCYLSGEDYSIPVAAMSDWQTRFRNWIESPILHNISSARPYFDLDPALGNEGLWAGLQRNVLDAIRAEDSFVRVMANDCLSSLPPLTIFRDLVVEGTGAHSAVFQLEKKALQPIVDVARVFGIAAGCVPGSTSLARLGMARTMLPDHEGVFREAADTLRIVLYHQARAGIRTESDGAELPPAILSGHDRQVLKSGFRCILQLLEFTDGCRWLEAR